MIPLRSRRLTLREFRRDDLDESLTVVSDETVTRWLSFDSKSRTEQAALLDAVIARASADPRDEYYFAICIRETGRLVGFCRLGLSGVRAGKLGYALAGKHWGNGYATEAVATMLRFGFAELELHRITAAIGPDNTRSIALVQNLGFRYEGSLRDHVFTNGAWRHSVLYSLLSHEWATPARDTSGLL